MIATSDKQKAKSGSIAKFSDLQAWQSAHQLRLQVYKLTKRFPKEEQFALSSQLRRASTSIASCIAEGFSRRTARDKSHYYIMSQGSLTEVQDQLVLARDLKYITQDEFHHIADLTILTHKLITGLIKALEAGRGASR